MEHAYQAAKFDNIEIYEKVKNAKSSFRAKVIAKEHEKEFQRDNWEEIRVSVMEKLMRQKILQHEDVREALLKTGEAVIVENSSVDYFWGCGSDGTGQNQVGKA